MDSTGTNSPLQGSMLDGIKANLKVNTNGLNFVLGIHSSLGAGHGYSLLKHDIGHTLYLHDDNEAVVYRSTNEALDAFLTEHRATRQFVTYKIEGNTSPEPYTTSLIHRQLGTIIMGLNKPNRIITVIEDHSPSQWRYWIHTTLRLPLRDTVTLVDFNGSLKLWENDDVKYPGYSRLA